MKDNDIVELNDFKFNHYMHHFDEQAEEILQLEDDYDSEYSQDNDYMDLFWEA